MNVFKLLRDRHPDQSSVDQEFKNIIQQLQSFCIRGANRAPAAGDDGFLWIFEDGTTIRLYIKDKDSGTWRGPVNFT